MTQNLHSLIQKIVPYYRDIRQKIHANPELRYEEYQTAELIKQELEKLGLPVQVGIGKTGVVAIIDSGKPGKTVALRADMDALPLTEISQLSYRSQNKGKMHACGHDGHIATLLATAHVLNEMKSHLTGKIKFIFQPAEEGGAGAKAMIEDGVLENPAVDVIFGYHNHPGIAVGHVQTRVGCIMYGNTEFIIEVQGKSGHAAQPECAVNPIRVCAPILEKIEKLMQELSHDEPTIITITRINGGIATNIIPETCILSGTIRASSLEKSKETQQLLRSLIELTAKEHHAATKIEFQEIYPPTVNPATQVQFVLESAKVLLGEDKVSLKLQSSRAAEDFSFFLERIPGCYFLIGNGENSACCHNAQFDFNDDILPVGVALFCKLVGL